MKILRLGWDISALNKGKIHVSGENKDVLQINE